jgi:hypothetical protein
MPAPLYARYVPPKPSRPAASPPQSQSISTPASDHHAPLKAPDSESPRREDKQKKSKKKKHDRKDEEDDDRGQHPSSKVAKRKRHGEDGDTGKSGSPKKKKKSEKRAKQLEEEDARSADRGATEADDESMADGGAEGGEDQDLLRRHKSIFSKFQRSTQKARETGPRLDIDGQSDVESNQDEEPTELHGICAPYGINGSENVSLTL